MVSQVGRQYAEYLTKVWLGHQPMRIGLMVNPVMAGSGAVGVPRMRDTGSLGSDCLLSGSEALAILTSGQCISAHQFSINLDLGQGCRIH